MRHVRRHSRVGLARIGARVRNMLANRRRPLGDLRPGDLRRLCRLRRLGIGFIDVVRRQIAELLLPLQACGCRREVGHVRINDSVRFVAGLFESGFRSPQIRQRSNVVSIGASHRSCWLRGSYRLCGGDLSGSGLVRLRRCGSRIRPDISGHENQDEQTATHHNEIAEDRHDDTSALIRGQNYLRGHSFPEPQLRFNMM